MDGAEPQAADPEAADDEAPLPEGQFLVLLPGAAVVRRQPAVGAGRQVAFGVTFNRARSFASRECWRWSRGAGPPTRR